MAKKKRTRTEAPRIENWFRTVVEGFLREILDHPGDEARRLVFADWLMENGHPEWAEVIQLECMLARLTEDDPCQLEMRRRIGQLHGKRETLNPLGELAWAKKFWSFVNTDVYLEGVEETGWRSGDRGLASCIEASTAQFLRGAEKLWRTEPVTAVRLHGAGRRIETLAASSHLGRVTELNLWDNHLGDAGVKQLASSPHLTRLRKLNLGMNGIGPAGSHALASSPNLVNLTELKLNYNDFGPAGARALAASPYLRRLNSLELGANEIGPAGTNALADSIVDPENWTTG